MITNEILSHDIKFLLDTLNRLNEGTVKPELVRRVIEDIGKESERPPVTVIRGLPEPEVSTNLIEERKRLLGEVYIKLAEIRSKELAERRRKEQNVNTLGLPTELNTDKAKNLFSLAISNGICDNNYKWLKSKALLAYFADRASEYLELGKGEYDGKRKTSWKPFETLFGNKGLSGAKRDYQKTGTLPDGYKDVDKLFE